MASEINNFGRSGLKGSIKNYEFIAGNNKTYIRRVKRRWRNIKIFMGNKQEPFLN